MNKKKLLALLMALVMTLTLMPMTVWADDFSDGMDWIKNNKTDIMGVDYSTADIQPLPQAAISLLTASEYPGEGAVNFVGAKLQATQSDTADVFWGRWETEIVMTNNNAIPANTIEPLGQYDAYSEDWVSLGNLDVLSENTEIRVIHSVLPVGLKDMFAEAVGKKADDLLGIPYAGISRIVKAFNCGVNVTNLDNILPGTQLTMQLRLYAPCTLDDATVARFTQAGINLIWDAVKSRYYAVAPTATGEQTAVFDLPYYVAQIVSGESELSKHTTLQGALDAVADGQTVRLLSNLNIVGNNAEAALADKAVTLDLGGYTLTGRINLRSGVLTVQNGTMTHTENGQRAIDVYGTDDASYNTSDNVYTKLVVANNVTISGGSYGIVVAGKTLTDKYAYGVVVEMNGTISDTNDGIFVMGNIGDDEASGNAMKAAAVAPKITVNGSITTNDLGIQMSGASEVTVNGSVTAPTAIGVKRGHLTVANSAAIHATGEKVNPVLANNNGTEQSGAAISVTSTYNYAGDIRVDVNGGTITSDNNATLYVGHAKKDNNYVAFVKGTAISVSNGNFKGGVNTAAVFVADAISGDATMPAGFITGGKYSAEPDSSYVKTGYKAANISDTNYPYQVGVATIEPATEGSIEGDTPATQVTYTVSTTVKETEESETPLETVTNLAVTVTGKTTETVVADGSSKGVASLSNIKDNTTLSAIVADAIEAAGASINDQTSSASIVIQLAKSAADETTVNNTVTKLTFEVHPEAVISVDGVEVGTVALGNNQIKDSFSFTLDVSALGLPNGSRVKVTHKHSDNSEDTVYNDLVVENGKVTITNVNSFSDFVVEKIGDTENSAKLAFEGTSLRRRVRVMNTQPTNEVVRSSTDARFGYSWVLPAGYYVDDTVQSFFEWSKDGVSWKTVAMTNYSGNTANLVINNIPSGNFNTSIRTRLTLAYTDGTNHYTITMTASPKTAHDAAVALAALDSTVTANQKWIAYGNYLQGSYKSYTINNSELGFEVVE